MGGVAKEVEDTGARNIGIIDKIVFKKFDNKYTTMNPSEQNDAHTCHKCHIKDPVISEFPKLV